MPKIYILYIAKSQMNHVLLYAEDLYSVYGQESVFPLCMSMNGSDVS